MLSLRSLLHPSSPSGGVKIHTSASWISGVEDNENSILEHSDSVAALGDDSLLAVSWQMHTLTLLLMFGNMALLRIPLVANSVNNLLRFVPNLDPTHTLEPLSLLDWLVHLPLMPLGVELCTTLWNTIRTPYSKNLAILFGLNFVQGWLTNMDHSLVNVHGDLQMKVWSLSYLALNSSVFMGGIICWLPNTSAAASGIRKWGWGLASLVGYGIWTQRIGFQNMAGRVLATSALAAILSQKDLSRFFKASYVLLSLAPAVVPNSATDRGHLLGAAYVTCALGLLVASTKRMVPASSRKQE